MNLNPLTWFRSKVDEAYSRLLSKALDDMNSEIANGTYKPLLVKGPPTPGTPYVNARGEYIVPKGYPMQSQCMDARVVGMEARISALEATVAAKVPHPTSDHDPSADIAAVRIELERRAAIHMPPPCLVYVGVKRLNRLRKFMGMHYMHQTPFIFGIPIYQLSLHPEYFGFVHPDEAE